MIWRNEFATIDQARAAIGAYVDRRTPKEVSQTWEDAREEFDGLQNQAA